eukprot:gene15843-3848_t
MLLLLSLVYAVSGTGSGSGPLKMEAIGAYCSGFDVDPAGLNGTGCSETTPFLWHGQLHVAEHHSEFRIRRQALPGCDTTVAADAEGGCDNSIVIQRVPGTKGIAFVSATVNENKDGEPTLWLFGTNDDAMQGGKSRTQVHTFYSSDPALGASSWKSSMILQFKQSGSDPKPPTPSWQVPWWTAFNTSPTKGVLNGKDVWLGTPEPLIGVRFTSVFAVCESCAEPAGDLSKGWSVLDPDTHIYRKDRYSACPTIRYYNGHTWEESPYGGNNTIIMGLPDGGGPNEKGFVRNQTDDINRSDMDMVTLPSGDTYVVWGSGNQGVPTAPNIGFGAGVAGIVKGTEQEWLESFF